MDREFEKEKPEDEDSDEIMESDNDEEAAMANIECNRNFIEPPIERSLTSLLSDDPNLDTKSLDPILPHILKSFQFNFHELSTNLFRKNNLVKLELVKCSIVQYNEEILPPISTIKEITFRNCSSSIIQAFANQNSLEKITVIANEPISNGFDHEAFNKMCKNSKNINHIVLKGAGTGSYFDCDEFPYKISKLEATMITRRWYVGLKEAPIKFLQAQKGTLKELTINNLPNDFKGGEVLKYIIEEMNLDTFYYGKIPLILNGQKQKVKKFTASEIQITSAYEMLWQFPSIEKFTLKFSKTEIASDAIEKIINPPTDLFNNLKEFEVIDNSSYRGIFGVFLELFKNLKNINKLTLRTQDRNINTILENLPKMPQLEEIQLTSTEPEASERYKIIKQLAPNLKIIKVARGNSVELHELFQGGVQIDDIDELDQLGVANDLLEEGEDNEGDNRDRGRDEDEDENFEGFTPAIVSQGNIVIRTEPSQVVSSFDNENLNENVAYYNLHAFGYYSNILNQLNVAQLETLLGDLYSLILELRTEQGKILVRFRENTVENRNAIKDGLMKFAFIQMNQIIQLPLIILSTNYRIKVSCVILTNPNWDRFVRHISQSNRISGSLWTYVGIEDVLVGGQRGSKLTFNVDARSFTKIQERNFTLVYDASDVTITEVNNPYTHDIRQLPV